MSRISVLEKLALAMKYCKKCKTLFRSDQKVCSYCRSKEFEENNDKVLEIIVKDPFLNELV